jgi:hypothetical protein
LVHAEGKSNFGVLDSINLIPLNFFGWLRPHKQKFLLFGLSGKRLFCSITHQFHTFYELFWEEKQVSMGMTESKKGKVKYKYFTFLV